MMERSPLSSEAVLDADFDRRLDRWGTFQRIGLSGAGLIIVLLLLPHATWVIGVCALHFANALCVLHWVREGRPEAGKAKTRMALVFGDITLVSLLSYGWGTHTSPASFMYLPIVVGFTLVPQGNKLGKLAVWLTLGTVAGLLVLESRGLIPFAPLRIDPEPHELPNRLFFFALFAAAVGGVQGAVEFTVARLRDHSRSVNRLIAESDQREREAELSSQLEEAARLEALGRLSGGIAHDFNNLLMALLGYAELAQTKLESDPAFVAKALADMERAAEHGRELTAQLLDFASRRPARAVSVELGQLLRETSKLLSRLLRSTVNLELVLCDEPCVIHIDPSSLERALFNLAVNASDAMPNGGTLTLRLVREDKQVPAQALICVEDQGTGIAEADLPRIFEPFFTKKPRGKGTGLGLASVYGIVRQSQGDIDVHSVEGEGTCFELRFPLTELPAKASKAPRTQPPAGTGRVLLVDDNKLVRDVVEEQLRSAGYEVHSLATGDEVLSAIEQDRGWNLLVSDVVMPGMSGLELGTRARAACPGMPLLLISGYSPEISLDALRKLDAALLAKPFSRQQLLEAVQRALS
jgi:signal transduction histidine kinase